jgi:hypothetical protein
MESHRRGANPGTSDVDEQVHQRLTPKNIFASITSSAPPLPEGDTRERHIPCFPATLPELQHRYLN